MKFNGIVWLGVRTDKFNELADFYENKLKLSVIHNEHGFKTFDLPNGDRIEIFSDTYKNKEHFTTGPVAGFAVDNVEITREEMQKQGVEFIGKIQGTPGKTRWAHFRGPDGNIYEITDRRAR